MARNRKPGLHYAPRKTQEEKNRQDHYVRSDTSKIIKYLENFYDVIVPQNFFEELDEALSHSHHADFSFSLALVDVIVDACMLWEDYVEDIDSLICHEVLSMARIHVSVIWARSLLRDGFALKKEISSTRETIIDSRGTLTAIL